MFREGDKEEGTRGRGEERETPWQWTAKEGETEREGVGGEAKGHAKKGGDEQNTKGTRERRGPRGRAGRILLH